MSWHDTKLLKLCSNTAHACCHICISWSLNVLINVGWSLTPCRQVTQKCVIATPCIVDGSRICTFSYTTSCTCVCQLVWLTSLQGYQQLDAGCLGVKLRINRLVRPPIFRTIRLQQRDHSFRYSVFLQLQLWLCIGIFCKRTISCVSYMRIHILMSLVIVTLKVWTVTVTSPQLVHINSCDLLLVHWPNYFHTHFSSHLSRKFS
jgi:hypothetical protein